MRQILAFGDSNTWGMVPGTHARERFPWGVRWTSILQEKVSDNGVRIVEDGLCGRTTVFEDELRPGRKSISSLSFLLESHYPISGAILMLGTNDCKAVYNASAYTIGKGIERCLDVFEEYLDPKNILLVSPIHLGQDVWRPDKDPEFDKDSIKRSTQLKEVFGNIASDRGIAFMAASDFADPSIIDDEHLDEVGHDAFAGAVYSRLKSMELI